MSKSRLTISLSSSTLKKIDQLIDKKEIRNRSHAIEHLLEQSLKHRLKTAVILAGGVKLPNETMIKALTLIDKKPLISYTIDHLKKYGVEKVIIATNSRGKKIQELLGDGSQFNLTIDYLYEKKPLGTAGAIKNTKKLIKDTFYVIAGDILTNINLEDMLEFHIQNKSLVTMAVKPRMSQDSYDNVFMQGHRIVDFKKRQLGQTASIVNTGIYIFEHEIFQAIPDKTPTTLEQDVFPKLTENNRLLAFPFQGIWFDVSSDSNYKKVIKNINQK
ncbi:MAG: sugar phosphate nucleotidyltransferase [Candidatus Woesebacteria bacterium]|jgi:mannose-1-phosphate guanylyltransferase/phosphomannomutase